MEYEDWLGGNTKKPLWLLGGPGIGKLVIASFLVECLQSTARHTGERLVYYFCDNKDDHRNTTLEILRGILLQILRQDRPLFNAVKGDCKLKKTGIFGSVDALWAMLLRLLRSSSTHGTIILIDALDECWRESRQDLLGILQNIEPAHRVKIIITSRPEVDINEVANLQETSFPWMQPRSIPTCSFLLIRGWTSLRRRRKIFPRSSSKISGPPCTRKPVVLFSGYLSSSKTYQQPEQV